MSRPSWSPDLFQRASRFAAEAHQEQQVPGTQLPYLLHLMQVTAEVMGALAVEPHHDADLAVACALLHDTLEDTRVGFAELEAAFGPAVAQGVAALTKDTALSKDVQMADSLQRIRSQPMPVALVKLADRITNLQTPPAHWSTEKVRDYADEAEQIVRAIGLASPYLAERLKWKLLHYRAALERAGNAPEVTAAESV